MVFSPKKFLPSMFSTGFAKSENSGLSISGLSAPDPRTMPCTLLEGLSTDMSEFHNNITSCCYFD